MEWKPLADDTSAEAERIPIDRWRRMEPAEKLALVSGISQAVSALARCGIRQRYPLASPRDQFLRFALLTLGRDRAPVAYPEIAERDLE